MGMGTPQGGFERAQGVAQGMEASNTTGDHTGLLCTGGVVKPQQFPNLHTPKMVSTV